MSRRLPPMGSDKDRIEAARLQAEALAMCLIKHASFRLIMFWSGVGELESWKYWFDSAGAVCSEKV